MRFLVFAALISAACAATISKPNLEVAHNHLITGGLKGNTETRTLTQDVYAAKTATANYMKELHLEITQNLQLYYLIIVDVANRAADMYRYMTELGVPESTLSDILQSGQSYFAQYAENFRAVQSSFEDLRETTFTVFKEVIGLNATLMDSYNQLVLQHALNDQNYLDSFSVLDDMIISGEGMILEAINGMSGQQVIEVYLALQDIKTVIANKEEDMERARIYYKLIQSDYFFKVNVVAEQLVANVE